MTEPPPYFEPIRLKAAQRWAQLEADPELAAPWHQLFAQVQSPRHVLSELLQNADDAGATEASVQIKKNVFTFEHNGEDFTEKHFASLCRFGYSNKRALHTIGFRGIGFKSTFSLGNRVDLSSPTLSVAFHRARFTEPQWLAGGAETNGKTRVQVAMSEFHRIAEVEKNFDEWVSSAESLLFFRSVRRLQVRDHVVQWHNVGTGPVPGGQYMALEGKESHVLLLLRSEEEMLPAPVVAEIRQERMMEAGDLADLPACRVEVLVGAPGKLFVVLPTGVKTSLPFACNAPFLQDPARLRIKATETSPTNRWLLGRIGRLAATGMLEWLNRTDLATSDRAKAYGLLPAIETADNSLEGRVRMAVEAAMVQTLADRPILLTESGTLVHALEGIAIPRVVLNTWPSDKASALVDARGRPPLCPDIPEADAKKLIDRGLVDAVSLETLLAALQKRSPEMPRSWRHLLEFWSFVAPAITKLPRFEPFESLARAVRILPVQGDSALEGAAAAVRLGESRLLQSDADWNFLSAHLRVLNQNWTRFLAEQRRSAQESRDAQYLGDVDAAYRVLTRLGLDQACDAGDVIDRFAASFFSQRTVERVDCFRLAHIAAKLDARVGPSFRFLTRQGVLRETSWQVMFDDGKDGGLLDLLPEQEALKILDPDYVAPNASCSPDEWQAWIGSGRSGLLTFVPLRSREANIPRTQIPDEARRRGGTGHFTQPYRTNSFRIEDFDFEPDTWRHWAARAADDVRVWARVTSRIFAQQRFYWEGARTARILQVATNNILGPDALHREGLAGNADTVLHPGVADIPLRDAQFPGNPAYGIQGSHAPFLDGQI